MAAAVRLSRMIRLDHCCIRSSDTDDAAALQGVYGGTGLRAALLDNRREPLYAVRDELREVLARRDPARVVFYTIEQLDGTIAGFVGLRGLNPEAAYGDALFLFADDTDLTTPLAQEAAAFLFERAFGTMRLKKIVVHALASESALIAFLRTHHFQPCGTQREVLYSQGRYHNLELWELHAPAVANAL